jgi:hypothetical protein
MGIKTKLENGLNFIRDRLWAHHVCGCIIFFIATIIFIVTFILLMPFWVFQPALTFCLVTKTPTIQKAYISLEPDDYVTFAKFRGAIQVVYKVGDKTLNSTSYGPYNEQYEQPKDKFNEVGYGLSKVLVKDWMNKFIVKKKKTKN